MPLHETTAFQGSLTAIKDTTELVHSTDRDTTFSRACTAIDDDENASVSTNAKSQRSDSPNVAHLRGEPFVEYLRSNIIGKNITFTTPFGLKPLVYVDYTASGRSLQCIEDYIQTQVMPFYGNTHTTTSITGLQSTAFREEARDVIAEAVKAKKHKDAVIFTGSGSTGAVHKLVHILGLHLPHSKMSKRPVVFVGPFEHHSNLLPWRESHCDVIQIHESDEGLVDMAHLTQMLKKYAGRPLKIGSFSAASNVTGIVSDVNTIASLLHTHGALAFFDYASCAPYVDIDMNAGSLSYKDAIFFSGHKFLGGPGSPGVLVVKKKLFMTSVPTTPGGGTVLYVTQNDHYYVNHVEEREEGGTPDTIGSIRLGLAFQIKQRVGIPAILDHEMDNLDKAVERLQVLSHITLLGPGPVADKLPILSFLIRCRNRFLHYNFVGALLNDLFGIQSRGGCACAGPYGQRLLGISDTNTQKFKAVLRQNDQVLKPGYTRLSLPYILSQDEVEYVIAAVEFVALHGWKFLPQYEFKEETGEWTHVNIEIATEKRLFKDFLDATTDAPVKDLNNYKVYLDEAIALADHAVASMNAQSYAARGVLSPKKEPLRWFLYPWEVVKFMHTKNCRAYVPMEPLVGPVAPNSYEKRDDRRGVRDSMIYRGSLWNRLSVKLSGRRASVAGADENSKRSSVFSSLRSSLAHL